MQSNNYFLIVDWYVIEKAIKKQPQNVITIIKRDISMLKHGSLNGSKIIDQHKAAILYKKRYQEVEIYYSITSNEIVKVLDVIYLGTSKLHGIETGIKGGQHKGNKTTQQQKSIDKYKSLFRKNI